MAEPVDDPLQETGQAIGGTLRTAAAGAGEILRMKLTRQAFEDRDTAVSAGLVARALTRRLEAEQATARSLYRLPADPAWWRSASAGDVVGVWDAATAFAETDPAARSALKSLDEGLREHSQLREDVVRHYPQSLAAQTVVAQPVAGEAGGLTLAAAADLEAELRDEAFEREALVAHVAAGAIDDPRYEDILAAVNGDWPFDQDPATLAALVGEDFPSGAAPDRLKTLAAGDSGGINPHPSVDLGAEAPAAIDVGRLLEDDFPAGARGSARHLAPAANSATPPSALALPPALSLPGAGMER